MKPSIFTKIVRGEIPAHKVYEDDKVLAFMERYPINPGHVLVIPKKEVDHIWDIDDEDYVYLWKIAKKIAKHIKQVIGSPRVGAIVEGFGVPHAHIHLVPIYMPDDIKRAQDHNQLADDNALAEMAERLSITKD